MWIEIEASTLAMNVELTEKTPCVFSGNIRCMHSFDITNDKETSVGTRLTTMRIRDLVVLVVMRKDPVQKTNNPYPESSADRCFRCGGQGHRSNVYLSRRTAE